MAKRTDPPEKQLKDRRERANLTQLALAQQIGVDKSTVCLWENGRRKPDRTNSWKLFVLLKLKPMAWQ